MSYSGPVFQDWTPVTIRSREQKKEQVQQHQNPAGTKRMKELLEDDIPKVIYYTSEQAQAMIQARSANKLTQDQLAKRCNLNISIIRDIENKKAVYNKGMYSRIMKAMNVMI